MFMMLQMLMNAGHHFMAVHITVTMLGEVTIVHVNLDMNWTPT
jgi:hypothetical protein